jgi:hypothetical protein
MSIEEIQKIQTKITATENEIKQNELTFYNNRELIEKIRDETKNTEAKLQLEKFKKYTNNLIDLNKGKLRIFEMKNKVTNMFLDEYTKQATYLKTLGTDQNPEDTKILNDYFQGTNSKFKPTNFTNSGKYVLNSVQLSEAINLLTTLKNEHVEEADTNVNKAIKYLSALVILNSSYINTPTTL